MSGVKRLALGRRVAVFSCSAVVAALIVGLLFAGVLFAGIIASVAQQNASASDIVPMPVLADALHDTGHPEYAAVIEAAQAAVGLPVGSTQSNERMQLLLAMAWVDSRWGTQAGANPILSGSPAMVAAQAAMGVGLQPTDKNFIYALAISDAESSFNPKIGLCNDNHTDYTYPNFPDWCQSLDDGLWQINTTPGGYSNWTRAQLTDPLTNARAMMRKSNSGTSWAAWCTAWSGGTCGVGTLLGCPDSSGRYARFCADMPLATQIAQQVSGSYLSAQYTGIILMLKNIWNSRLGGADPNSVANAKRVMNVVNAMLLPTQPGIDPLAQITAFYSIGSNGTNSSAIDAHAQLVDATYQLGYGGGAGYINPIQPHMWAPWRTDQGVDWQPINPDTPVLAIGDGVITFSSSHNTGWPFDYADSRNGGFMTYKLTSGPQKGYYIYVAEHLTHMLPEGAVIRAGQTIALAQPGYAWTEWGWAKPAGMGVYGGPATPYGANNCDCATSGGKAFARFLIQLGAKPLDDPGPGPITPY